MTEESQSSAKSNLLNIEVEKQKKKSAVSENKSRE